MIQIYKIMHGLDDLDPTQVFDCPSENRTHGHRYKFAKKQIYSKLRHSSFFTEIINEWNNLSSDVEESISLYSLKIQPVESLVIKKRYI